MLIQGEASHLAGPAACPPICTTHSGVTAPGPRIMRVGSANIVVSSLAKTVKSRAASKRAPKTPNCTHINMDRIYDDNEICHVCGRFPDIGFLYVCRQQDVPGLPLFDIDPALKSELRMELELVGLSHSVIETAERGEYTAEQLEKLRSQKLHLKQIISGALEASTVGGPYAKLWAHGVANNDGTCHSHPEKDPRIEKCKFKACHACRPYYKDRAYCNVASVFSSSPPPPLTDLDALALPIKDARILRYIGLLSSPRSPDATASDSPGLTTQRTDMSTTSELRSSGASILTFRTTQTDMDDLSQLRHPRRRFYNLGNRDSDDIARDLAGLSPSWRRCLKTAIQNIFRPSRESSSSGSNITLPLPRTGTVRDLTKRARDFDIGSLRRVKNQQERMDLRGTILYGLSEGFPGAYPSEYSRRTDLDTDTVSDFSVCTCASQGSEVEVDGGVALTEEAVETHIPDILCPDSCEGQDGVAAIDCNPVMTQV
ncbi:hypothetical protein CC78DRAFT_543868 [Lojkania enalia]|uniref:Uncharacterized protein n=1 Tax=Lojkania enalia TaxID=147567 RepID=A0A9P4N8H6_9PLEO|nr:hypothetical protein CC78DRAFT_543868 [Didymosphaeria enalia]